MLRNLSRLETDAFDLLVVGGGIHGAAVAWDASLRGLRVALVEQRDFGSGTTANSLRIAHGGLRAMQRLLVGRVRRSAQEQAILLRLAPSLVRPLPCLVPIYRDRGPSPAAYRAAFAGYRMLTADIHRRFRVSLPDSRVISRNEALTCFEGLESEALAGGALWYDAQVPAIERLVLGFVASAAEQGAATANYVRARRLLLEQGNVVGAEVTDQRTGANWRIRARCVVNAAGPWVAELAESRTGEAAGIPRHWAQGVNLVINRPPPPVAIGIRSPWGRDRDPVMGGHRYLFMAGWNGTTLAGTSYRFAAGNGPSLSRQVRELVEEWNEASPGLKLGLDEVSHPHCGRLPLRDGMEPGRPTALMDHGTVVEHGRQGLRGLVTVIGTKFTTARHLAATTVSAVQRLLGLPVTDSPTDLVPLTIGAPPDGLDGKIRYAIREEMAQTLEDIVMRRLESAPTRCPPVSQLGRVADIAGAELGWTEHQTNEEIHQVLGRFLPGGVTRAA